ncbi:MAG: hypothetical protein IIX01_01990, partial [Clostridia bacterium]|nr:hypothetical protein [Clostridia bacterium]
PFDMTAVVSNEAFWEEKKQSAQYSDGYIENICLYREICLQMPAFNRFLLHAAVLEYGGNGYAFLGRSGAGKSTHTSLWLKYVQGSKILNGDKPVVAFDGKDFYAYGTPWMGKEGRGCKGKAPIKALCFIEQAKENSIERLSPSELTDRIFTQLLMPTDEDGVEKTLYLADKLVCNVPAFVLKCDISQDAVRHSFEAMTGEKYIHQGD